MARRMTKGLKPTCMKKCGIILILTAVIIAIIAKLYFEKITIDQPNYNPVEGSTPPMGWNSWNHFQCDGLNESVVKETVDLLISSGLAKAGYKYVNLDDCWQLTRNENGVIQEDQTKFPNGIKTLAEYVHSKGLKFGLYTCVGTLTCGRRPGSYGYEEIDAQTYADWKVDFVKNDDCYIHPGENIEKSYQTMYAAIKNTGRQMIHSVKGSAENLELASGFSNMRRVNYDIKDNWINMMSLVDWAFSKNLYDHSGLWHDLDMLEVGNGGMTTEEYKVHFSLWSALKSPLILGNDPKMMKDSVKNILTNPEVININQDPLGKPVSLVREEKLGHAEHLAVSDLRCTRNDTNQQWSYSKEKRWLKHVKLDLCLTANVTSKLVTVEKCGRSDLHQAWTVDEERNKIYFNIASGKTYCLELKSWEMYGQATVKKCPKKPTYKEKIYFEKSASNTSSYVIYNLKTFNDKCLKVGGVADLQVYSGPLSKNRVVVLIVNRDVVDHGFSFNLEEYVNTEQDKHYVVKEVWEKFEFKAIGDTKLVTDFEIPSHSCKMFIITPQSKA
ncbi:alpha-galactosidase [Lingula anatina]|uniref:Alpha-galactosidase n=1 Tax=Lingula anatina TaxID=7574 RepID=A0A1S3HHH7_LINAN|nr:alpha-galactosidase [Lingula anatina]|eukprot:XP_013385555.1 alpha-galactosidase [Lingula anatina]